MSSPSSPNVPYKPYTPRRQRSARPDRPLPPPPPPDAAEDNGPEEDVGAINAVDLVQGFTSPPSPPRISSLSFNETQSRRDKELPPPPHSAPADQHEYGQGSRRAGDGLPPPPQSASAVPSTSTSSSAAGTGTAPQVSAQHLHPYHSTLPTSSMEPPTILTPLRAHYLKKTLVNLQVTHELGLITDPVLGANALGLLGDPFVLPDSAKKDAMARVSEISRQEGSSLGDLPFLRFMFHQFLLPFPFLATAPPTFWSAKVQPFLSSFLATTGVAGHATLTEQEQEVAESLMTKEERKEAQERKKLWAKVEKHLALMFGVGIKLTSGEEVVRIGQAELRRLEELQEERRRKWVEKHGGQQGVANTMDPTQGFEVNVVGVRVVTEKGRVRHRSHEEFIIRTRRNGVSDTFVTRRYGDFRRLADELRLAFPDYPIPPPPPKDKTATAAAVVSPPASAGYSAYNPLRMIYGSGTPATGSPDPGSPSGYATPSTSSTAGPPDSPSSPTTQTTPLSREKNRLTLRAYLQSILALPFIINSPILRSFLLSAPTALTPPETVDCQRRLEADAVREEGRRRFRLEAEKRIEALREGLAQFKGDVLSKEGGLKGVFEVVRRVEKVEDLPKAEASVLEWGRISLAATIFQLFVASDTASDTLAGLKRLHGLMPYFVLKGILKISNPMAMIRGVLDLFLARPFGGQSLIQRMFSSSLTEDVRLLGEDIEAVQEKIDDPVLCQKIEQYAMAPFEIQEVFRKDAASEGIDLLVVILRSPSVPSLSRPQFQRVARATRAYHEYKNAQAELDDSDDDMGPDNDDAWLYEDLSVLLKLWMRKREKEGLLALIFEGVTAELLKDIITIFYAPLATVYKAASIADSLGDMQAFINDMIRTVEQVEELSQEDPQRTVQTFIDLVQRHEQSFYTFVHNVHSKGQGLFDSLMAWIELFLDYARSGLPRPMDLEFILPAADEARRAVMKEVDAVAEYHYKLKVAHEEKIRRRFRSVGPGGPGGGGAGAIGENGNEEAALLDSVMASLSIGETAVAEGGEIADEESEEDEEEDEEELEREIALSEFQSRRAGARPGVEGDDSERSSINSSLLSPPPATPGGGGGENQQRHSRRGSHGSTSAGAGRKSIEKIRNSLDFKRRGSPDTDKEKTSSTVRGGGDRDPTNEPGRPPRSPHQPPSSANSSPGQSQGHEHQQHGRRRRRKKRDNELLVQPQTKAIEDLRPLFVEMIRPNLRVKPLK
ncbi:PX domain-containing protein [Kwoniella heveanensis BCC8398]|uniref:PX domain-containing protein n=1 Tax=Kwoniella heveanensis BCC8398 TaxID=1296120 RepID=A0A1B9GLE2_9TREE|nr:PX domain-containing protein [Kwoniella heveanensis BCC8398]